MSKTNLKLAAFAALCAAITIVSFQNCSGSKGSDANTAASACQSRSVMKVAFPQGRSFSIPQGISNTPYSCVNQSGYDTMIFDASKQQLTLSGSAGTLVYSLATGGGGCNGEHSTGGDVWRAGSESIETSIKSATVEINAGTDIQCTFDR